MSSNCLIDTVNECTAIIEFISYTFAHVPPGEQTEPMTSTEAAGLSFLLSEMSRKINAACDACWATRGKEGN